MHFCFYNSIQINMTMFFVDNVVNFNRDKNFKVLQNLKLLLFKPIRYL